MREPPSPKVLTADQVANLGQQAQNVITAQRKSPTIPGAWLHVADLVATVEAMTARLTDIETAARNLLDDADNWRHLNRAVMQLRHVLDVDANQTEDGT